MTETKTDEPVRGEDYIAKMEEKIRKLEDAQARLLEEKAKSLLGGHAEAGTERKVIETDKEYAQRVLRGDV